VKILFITGTSTYGGAEKHALILADFYRNHLNWDVEFWFWDGGKGILNDKCKAINVNTRCTPRFRLNDKKDNNFWSRLKYIRFINRQKIDVVMTFNNKPNIFGAYLLPKTNIKLHVWAQQGIDGHQFDSPLEQKALKNITCVISNSINGANFLKSIAVSDSIIHVVYNGIDTNLPLIDSSEWVKRLNPKPNSFNAIMVANITKLKDHITLVKAWKIVVEELKNENIEANLYLAGREDNQAELTKKTISDLNLNQNIHILGVVKDVYNLVNIMDLAILSSPSEGLPNAVLECMLLAKPFVGTNIEGIKEAVGSDNYQYLSNYQDEKTLASNILKFAKNKNLATAVGEKNKKWVETQFPISKLWNETHQIILEKLN
jgi:glycosyltransferase involved in cell wall biosynthesis